MAGELQSVSRLSAILLRVAVTLLPVTEQARFLREWRAEAAAVRVHSGSRAQIGFAARLVAAAPRMNLAMRADSQNGYAELSIGFGFSIFPSAVLAGLAIYTQVWIMLFAELAIIVGIVLAASGFWSFEGGLLDSARSRIGVLLVFLGSAIEVAVRRITGFGPPIDEVASATIPHAMIMAGLILLIASSYARRFRRRIQLVAVALLAPGAAANMVVAVINGAALNGFDRFGVLMYVVPSAAIAWASYSVLGRPQVFDNNAVVEV